MREKVKFEKDVFEKIKSNRGDFTSVSTERLNINEKKVEMGGG